MIRTAVILAAGMGSRMGQIAAGKPKGFLEVGSGPIVEQSICKLIQSGIDKIIIGTGHSAETYEHLAPKYSQVICLKNPLYAHTGSMYTLYCLKDQIRGDFLLLESDILYERKALWELLYDPRPNVVLASGESGAEDVVYLATGPDRVLTGVSKEKTDLDLVDICELVGIVKISFALFTHLCKEAEKLFCSVPRLDYETMLALADGNHVIYVKKLDSLAWCEIDNPLQLKHAENNIYPQILENEKHSIINRNILLTPGPAITTDSVKFAQVVPDICHREEEFGKMVSILSDELTQIVADTSDYTTVLLGGSGTAAVEAILSSALGRGTAIIISNGQYGRRMCEIAAAYRLDYAAFESAWDTPLNLEDLENLLRSKAGEISYLCVVHCETTTGLLNDITSIGRLCKRYGISLIVDCMSSFGAVPIDMRAMNIAFLAASSNKCLQGMPGVSFIIAAKESLEKIKEIPRTNYYLDLWAQYDYFRRQRQFRFTPPVQALYALRQAVIELKLEGVSRRYERYQALWENLVCGLSRLGLKHLVPAECHSKIITAVIPPRIRTFVFTELHDFLLSHGVTIYPGKVTELDTFRVANIGNLTHEDIALFLELLSQYLKTIGHIPGPTEKGENYEDG